MKKFDFSKGFGNIDPKYISEAEGEWKEKKNVWIASFWSKLAAACVILALISTVLSNPKVQAATESKNQYLLTKISLSSAFIFVAGSREI